jgi:hypothetical protein
MARQKSQLKRWHDVQIRRSPDVVKWIVGLMAENTAELGFVPYTAVAERYVPLGRYVFQLDERGNPVGYLLHGALKRGRPVVISQACIQYEKRMCGYGRIAFDVVRTRALVAGCTSIRLRCAEDIEAVLFWQSCGFVVDSVVAGGKQRQRMIANMVCVLDLPLLELMDCCS